MILWETEFHAICAKTGDLVTYCGPNVVAISKKFAQKWCNENMGHLHVKGMLKMIEVDGKWENAMQICDN